MNALSAVAVAALTSLFVSSVLTATLVGPLRPLLGRLCPGPESERFWARFTIVILYLTPLLVALVFGVPASSELASASAGALIRQVASASLSGALLALIAIGLRLSTLGSRGVISTGPERREWNVRT
jgi:hypothetical protein